MKLRQWFAMRGGAFVRKRGLAVLDRYGITPKKAEARVEACMATFVEHGCAPTFPTPGRVVRQHSSFIRHLQDAGAEIAVHSYDHLNLKAYPLLEAMRQLEKAVETFRHYGIEAHGFRCPYLGCTDELVNALPPGLFGYSSNDAIKWDVVPDNITCAGTVYDTIDRFYQPRPAADTVSVPWMRADVVEIPVSVPDDLQLHDGLQMGSSAIVEAWIDLLNQTHARGELLTLMFHPELVSCCLTAYAALLGRAKQMQPLVWIARLRDINDWWREKMHFRCTVSRSSDGLRITFDCSNRATILTRGLGTWGSKRPWDGEYYRWHGYVIEVPDGFYPFVGLPWNAPTHVVSFLREQGYILRQGEAAGSCGVYLDDDTLAKLGSQRELVDYIEASTGPLVRYWRWPDGAKSAMCVTGDLDALSLLDYGFRVFVH